MAAIGVELVVLALPAVEENRGVVEGVVVHVQIVHVLVDRVHAVPSARELGEVEDLDAFR